MHRASRRKRTQLLLLLLLLCCLYPLSLHARRFVVVLPQDDLKDGPTVSSDPADADSTSTVDWDEFDDSGTKSEEDLDPGSWRSVLEPGGVSYSGAGDPGVVEPDVADYYSGVQKMMQAVSVGEVRLMEEASTEIEAAAVAGNPHAQSVLGFMYGMGQVKERNKAKAFLHHHFASEGGNMQSKMALAYTYLRQDVSDLMTHSLDVVDLLFYLNCEI